jgi:glycopeptide antibiotics resistance protein
MKGRKWDICIFSVYCTLMVCLLFGRAQYEPALRAENFNPMPFDTILRFVRVLGGDYSLAMKRHAVVNLVGNVIMFVPLGYFTARLWRTFRPLWRCALLGAGIIVCVELAQFLNRVGSCDFDDLLLNVVGICIGYGLMWLVCRRQASN